jgi:hypothetical protein
MCNITQLSQLDFSKIYSYTDYLTWQFDQAVELIKGKNFINIARAECKSSIYCAKSDY